MEDNSNEVWSYEQAKLKCSERYSCFVEVTTEQRMSLSPFYIGRIKQGVQEHIERRIKGWKYNEQFQGIIVSYSNIKLLEKCAEIYDDAPLLHFTVQVNYIIFRPEVGKKLIGVVNKTSATHVGCLVHGRFNAALSKPVGGLWVGSRLDIGMEFVFRVTGLQSVAGVLAISGEIKEKDVKYFKPAQPVFNEYALKVENDIKENNSLKETEQSCGTDRNTNSLKIEKKYDILLNSVNTQSSLESSDKKHAKKPKEKINIKMEDLNSSFDSTLSGLERSEGSQKKKSKRKRNKEGIENGNDIHELSLNNSKSSREDSGKKKKSKKDKEKIKDTHKEKEMHESFEMESTLNISERSNEESGKKKKTCVKIEQEMNNNGLQGELNDVKLSISERSNKEASRKKKSKRNGDITTEKELNNNHDKSGLHNSILSISEKSTTKDTSRTKKKSSKKDTGSFKVNEQFVKTEDHTKQPLPLKRKHSYTPDNAKKEKRKKRNDL